MKKITFLIIFFFLFSSVSLAALSDDIKGRMWLKMNRQQRVLYLHGLYAGLNIENADAAVKRSEQILPFHNDYEKTREALRKFYQPVRNLDTPVSVALQTIKREQAQ